MEAVLDRLPDQQVSAVLAKMQAPRLNGIADMPTLVQVVKDWKASLTVPTPAQPDHRLSFQEHGRRTAIRASPVPIDEV